MLFAGVGPPGTVPFHGALLFVGVGPPFPGDLVWPGVYGRVSADASKSLLQEFTDASKSPLQELPISFYSTCLPIACVGHRLLIIFIEDLSPPHFDSRVPGLATISTTYL